MKKALSYQLSAVSFGRTLRLAAAALLFAIAACGPPGDERQVKNAVSAFYDVYMTVRPSGVPNKEQQVEFRKVISTRLAGLLIVAAGVDESSAAGTKDAAPQRLEGDVFTSVDEGAASYKIAQCEIQKPAATCAVELTNSDKGKRANLTWQDKVFVVREGDRWVVDDIEFMGDQKFMHKGRLKDVLKQVIEEGKGPAA